MRHSGGRSATGRAWAHGIPRPGYRRPLRLLALLVALGHGVDTDAQELAPRAYWPAPKGTKVAVFGYQFSGGDIVTDPSLPIAGVDSKIHTASFTYQHTTDLFGRTTNVQLSLPYSGGMTEGFAEGEFRHRSFASFADARFRISVNLLGAPSMDAAGFQQLRAEPRTIVGASVEVQVPTGSYEADKLINTGANRWAVKPAVGLIWPVLPTWLLEVDLGVWLFGVNDDFLGQTREQEPIVSGELHLVKRFGPGFWAAFDFNYYAGGQTTVGADTRADLQKNSRIGGTLTFPFKRRHAIRGSYSTGLVTDAGGDYEIIGVSYIYAWQ